MKKKTTFLFSIVWYLLMANTTFAFTHADTLKGSNGRGRAWWDVQHYTLSVNFDTVRRSIKGNVTIDIALTGTPADSMQIDLQEPMLIDSIAEPGHPGSAFSFSREGSVYWVQNPAFRTWTTSEQKQLKIFYHGTPHVARNPPWDGGFTWTHDATGKLWIAVSCQGNGASLWWPCKDAQWDEPDSGIDITLAVPGNYLAVSNGRMQKASLLPDGMMTYNWQVKNPINTYDATFYIGDYIHWHDTLAGEKGNLDVDFYALRNNEEKARKQFAVVKPMLHCFEYWLGPYPFYEDGYKLVEAPYLGMEHQGAVAYGNGYRMGYKGTDRSYSGQGLKFDYIIIHESAHEWYGNNITAKDVADNWIHEGITTFSESLFAECLLGKDKAKLYERGEWQNILNNRPIQGDYGVNKEGSGDMYDKGAAMMYMIRMMTNDDEKFRQMLRGLTATFYHQVVTTEQVETFIAEKTGLDLKAFFDQYLRKSSVPELEYYLKDKTLNFRFTNTSPGFTLPIPVSAKNNETTIHPTGEWQQVKWNGGYNIEFSKDFLIDIKK